MDMKHILYKFYESRFNPHEVMRILRFGNFWRKIIIIIIIKIIPTETIGLLRSLEALNIAVGDSDAGLRVSGASAW